MEKAEPAAPPTGVVDLVEALRASVEQARSPKDTKDKASSSRASAKTTEKKPAAKKRATTASGTSPSQSLRSLTKAELYEKATRAGIRGRSSMSHDELADTRAGDSS